MKKEYIELLILTELNEVIGYNKELFKDRVTLLKNIINALSSDEHICEIMGGEVEALPKDFVFSDEEEEDVDRSVSYPHDLSSVWQSSQSLGFNKPFYSFKVTSLNFSEGYRVDIVLEGLGVYELYLTIGKDSKGEKGFVYAVPKEHFAQAYLVEKARKEYKTRFFITESKCSGYSAPVAVKQYCELNELKLHKIAVDNSEKDYKRRGVIEVDLSKYLPLRGSLKFPVYEVDSIDSGYVLFAIPSGNLPDTTMTSSGVSIPLIIEENVLREIAVQSLGLTPLEILPIDSVYNPFNAFIIGRRVERGER